MSLPGIEPRFRGFLVCSLVTVPTKLSRCFWMKWVSIQESWKCKGKTGLETMGQNSSRQHIWRVHGHCFQSKPSLSVATFSIPPHGLPNTPRLLQLASTQLCSTNWTLKCVGLGRIRTLRSDCRCGELCGCLVLQLSVWRSLHC